MSNHAATRKPSARDRLKQPVAPRKENRLVGGIPQVSLLPGEILEAGHAAHHRRRLVAAVVLAAVVASAGIFVANEIETAAQQRLASANQQTRILASQLGKFDDVRSLQRRIALETSAVTVGSSTHIDWNRQISAILAGQPAGYRLTGISASGATPLATFAQGTTAVDSRRAATIILTLNTASVGNEFSTWLRQLPSIPSVADVSATTAKDTNSETTVTITVNLNPTAITTAPATESE